MMRISKMIFCHYVEPVEHDSINAEDFWKVKCLQKVCPYANQEGSNVICLSHNNGLHIKAVDRIDSND